MFAAANMMLKIKINGQLVPIGGISDLHYHLQNAVIDATKIGEGKFRTLESGGISSLSMNLEGVFLDTPGERALIEAAFSDEAPEMLIQGDAPDLLSGRFYIVSYEKYGENGGEEMFRVELESTGPITYTNVHT